MSIPEDAIPTEKVGMDYFESAPQRFDAYQIVRATPSQVFDVFEDAAAWPKWAPPITGVEWTSPFPIEVGSTRVVSMVGGLVGYEEFIAWERGKRMAFRFNAVSKPGTDAFAEDYRVTELAGGRSLVEWTMAMTPSGPGAKAFPVTGPLMSGGLSLMMRRFRKYTERTLG
jgi:hypothetical protein